MKKLLFLFAVMMAVPSFAFNDGILEYAVLDNETCKVTGAVGGVIIPWQNL